MMGPYWCHIGVIINSGIDEVMIGSKYHVGLDPFAATLHQNSGASVVMLVGVEGPNGGRRRAEEVDRVRGRVGSK